MNFQIYRIIDVNVNRAREALRVVEDICRLFINDSRITAQIKRLRHTVARSFKTSKLIAFRDSKSDFGRKVSFDRKRSIKTVVDILFSNLARSQESIRVLEEFSKLVKPSKFSMFKKIRFKLYDIEKEILEKLNK